MGRARAGAALDPGFRAHALRIGEHQQKENRPASNALLGASEKRPGMHFAGGGGGGSALL